MLRQIASWMQSSRAAVSVAIPPLLEPIFDVLQAADHTGAMNDSSRVVRVVPASESRALSAAAIWRGGAIGAAGALVMTTVLGIAAVVGMNLGRLSPEAMMHALQHGFAFRGFVGAGELMMAVAAGYAAARAAGRRQMVHAFWAAAATIVLKYVSWVFLGCPWPPLVAAIDLALVIPFSLLGGFLGSPCSIRPGRPSASSATTSRE
jgi:hypothetical protein